MAELSSCKTYNIEGHDTKDTLLQNDNRATSTLGQAAALPFQVRSQYCEKPSWLCHACLSIRMEQLGSYWTDFHEI
jgi:hypothetical protein